MGIADKVRQLKERAEEKLDQMKTKHEVESSAERIQRSRELYQKERSGQISQELATKRKKEIASDYERKKVPLAAKVVERTQASASEWNPLGGMTAGRERRRKAREKNPVSFWNPAPRKGSAQKYPAGFGTGFLTHQKPPRKGKKGRKGGNGGGGFGFSGGDLLL